MNRENGMASRACVIHLSATNHSNFFSIFENLQDVFIGVYRKSIDTADSDWISYLYNFGLFLPFLMRVDQISKFFVIDLKICNSDGCGKTVFAILFLFPAKNILKTHLQ